MSSQQFILYVFLCSIITLSAVFTNQTHSTLPMAMYAMAIGYDAQSKLIWILGGQPGSRQMTSFDTTKWNDPSPFNDYGTSAMPKNLPFYSFGQAYTYQDNYLYMVDARRINRFTFSTQLFEFAWKQFPSITDITSCVCHMNNYLIATGGEDYAFGSGVNRVQIYDISSDLFVSNVPSMHAIRAGHGCAVDTATNYLYQVGGLDINGVDKLNSVEKLYIGDLDNIADQNWIVLEDTLESPKSGINAISFKNTILIIGGGVKQIDMIHTLTDTISVYDNLLVGVIWPAVIAVGQRIYVFGGSTTEGSYGAFQLHGARATWQFHDSTFNVTWNNSSLPRFPLTTGSDSRADNNTASTIGGVIGGVLGGAVFILLLIICFKKKKKLKLENNDKSQENIASSIKMTPLQPTNQSSKIKPSAPPKTVEPGNNEGQNGTNNVCGEGEGMQNEQHMMIKSFFVENVKLSEYNDIYYDLFINHGFESMDLIQAITSQDLIEMGIEKVGHRKKILMAVQKLTNS